MFEAELKPEVGSNPVAELKPATELNRTGAKAHAGTPVYAPSRTAATRIRKSQVPHPARPRGGAKSESPLELVSVPRRSW